MANKLCKYCFRNEEVGEEVYEKPLMSKTERFFRNEIELVLSVDTSKNILSLDELCGCIWHQQVKIKFCPMCGRNLTEK